MPAGFDTALSKEESKNSNRPTKKMGIPAGSYFMSAFLKVKCIEVR